MSKYQLDALNSAPLLVRFQLFQTQHLTRGQTFLQNSRPAKRHEAIAGSHSLWVWNCSASTLSTLHWPMKNPLLHLMVPGNVLGRCASERKRLGERFYKPGWRGCPSAKSPLLSRSARSHSSTPQKNWPDDHALHHKEKRTHTHGARYVSIFNAWNQGEKPTLFQRIHHVVAGAQKWPLSALNCGTACLE